MSDEINPRAKKTTDHLNAILTQKRAPAPGDPSPAPPPPPPVRKVDGRKFRTRYGKSARPDEWVKSSMYLKPGPKYRAMDWLRRHGGGEDLSDLLARLLDAWLVNPTVRPDLDEEPRT